MLQELFVCLLCSCHSLVEMPVCQGTQGVSQRFHSQVLHQAVIWSVLMGFCVGEGDCLPVYSKPSNRIENVNGLVFVEIMFLA